MTPKEFNELAAVHLPRLVRSAVNKWGDEGEDYIQEAFLRAFDSLEQFRHECSFSTWIYSIAVIVSMEHHRASKLPFEEGADILKVPSEAISQEDHVYYVELLDMVDDLPHSQRKAIIDRVMGDTPCREAAKRSRKSMKTLLGE